MTTRRYDTILDAVGQTPVVRVSKLAPPGVELYAKLEAFNPMGSIKDRLALGIIEHAERTGALSPGQTVVEATSGNTGIGLAMVCAQKGYPLVIVMAENFSVERRKMMRFLGARVILTPAPARGTGMLAKAVELAETHGWFLCRQFENEANAAVHSETTAREIVEAFAGERLDYWVTGFGTGGTLKGVARVLKKERPDTEIVVCEPDNSRIMASGIPQPRDSDGNPSDSHPSFRTHLMQGWSPDFIPALAEEAVELELIDQTVAVSGDDALRFSRELARQEGIFTGITGGATFAAARRLSETAPAGSVVLCMLPDTGERYLSTPLFADIPTEMTPEEIEISRSSAGYRFDEPASSAPVNSTSRVDSADPAAVTFVDETILNDEHPVVVFALEWCEFCWSVRRLFEACHIEYLAIELDTAEAQVDDWGGRVRTALAERTATRTAPQVFVRDTFIGGCTEVFEAFRNGQLQQLLTGAGVTFTADNISDPYTFLPSWLHPR